MAESEREEFDRVFMPREEFTRRASEILTVLEGNPEAIGQFQDIVSDYNRLYDELDDRSLTIDNLNSDLRAVQASNMEYIKRMGSSIMDRPERDNRSIVGKVDTTRERRAVANSEERRPDGRFAGYPQDYNNNYGYNGNYGYQNTQGYGEIGGIRDPETILPKDLFDENGGWK